jgi:hypothetical protein
VGVNRPLVLDSITELRPEHAGRVVVCGSHGGIIAAYYAAKHGARGAVFNDAGVGKDAAGVAGLGYLDRFGIAAAAVGHLTARIGDGPDTVAAGIVTHADALAVERGVAPGMAVSEAAMHLERAPGAPAGPSPEQESRTLPAACRCRRPAASPR